MKQLVSDDTFWSRPLSGVCWCLLMMQVVPMNRCGQHQCPIWRLSLVLSFGACVAYGGIHSQS